MSVPNIEALASAWARIAEEATLPPDYEGTASPQAHRACEAIQVMQEQAVSKGLVHPHPLAALA